jgi:NADH-quinone oxidoreductase subunit H
MFFMTDFIEVVIVASLGTVLFFGGWQFPFLYRDGFHFGETIIWVPPLLVTIIGVLAYTVKSLLLCWFQIMLRWTLPRFRYDQLMKLGWIGLMPLGFLNAIVTALVILAATSH